jgi:hypothetical protein
MKNKIIIISILLASAFSASFFMLNHYAISSSRFLSLIHAYSLKLADITRPKKDELKVVVANDFMLKLERIPNVLVMGKYRSAGILQDPLGKLQVFMQSDAASILSEYKIDTKGRNVEGTITKNGGLKRIFKFQDYLIGLFTFVDSQSGCYYASLINLTKGVEFMRGPCLPESVGLDFNGIGGGHAELNGNLLVAIGTPTTDYLEISTLAQDLKSHYGKILRFSTKDVLVPFTLRKNMCFKGLELPAD